MSNKSKKRGRPSEKDLLKIEGKKLIDSGCSTLISFMKRTFTLNLYSIDKIIPNSFNVNVMTEKEFEKLKESIRITNGKYLRDNIIKIWYDSEQDLYIIIDGEHRWRACKELGYKEIPAEEEKDIDMNKIKELNVILSRNRGNDNHFKLSKLLNEEYWVDQDQENWKSKKGKRKCTQQDLAQRFGLSGQREVTNILNIYPRLIKNFENTGVPVFFSKTGRPVFFSNSHLDALSRCKNDLLREKLIDQSIKKEWNSKKIRKHTTRLNKFNTYLEKKYNDESIREDILNDFVGNSLFDLSIDLKKKIMKKEENDNLKLMNSMQSIWEKHNRTAIKIMESYDKEHGKVYSKGRYNEGYCSHPAYKLWEKDVFNCFEKFYKKKVVCFKDGVKLKLGKNFRAHHEEYIWDFICYVFLDGKQIVFPCCDKCHQKGTSENWNNNSKKII